MGRTRAGSSGWRRPGLIAPALALGVALAVALVSGVAAGTLNARSSARAPSAAALTVKTMTFNACANTT
jgi:hypothetical protein